MVDVEAERDALAAFIGERQQALAAEVERQARLVERPVVGNARFGREAQDPSRLGQGAPMAIGSPSQRQPSISRVARARQKAVSRRRACKRSRRWSILSGMAAPPWIESF